MDSKNLRPSTLLTPVSIGISAFFIIGFLIFTGLRGGLGFDPGPISAKSLPDIKLGSFSSHADFESQCSLCHQPLEASQARLCLACHEDIARQLTAQQGLHARLENAQQCSGCHSEHRGKDFDPTGSAIKTFNHNRTALPLTGKHGSLECSRCHTQDRYDLASAQCASCHQEPAVHAGLFHQDCGTCHTTFTWQNATIEDMPFDHELVKFTLTRHTKGYDNQPLRCNACHSGSVQQADLNTCVSCHNQHNVAFMQKHQAQYGKDCLACHDGKDRLHGFKHEQVFPLDGKHAALKCEQCHQNGQYRGTPQACAACHKEPDIHAGFFGQKCAYCHTSQAWRPAPLRAHSFPLGHGLRQGESDCKTCHSGAYQVYTCYGCHDHTQPELQASHASLALSPEKLNACTDCHLNGKVNKTKK